MNIAYIVQMIVINEKEIVSENNHVIVLKPLADNSICSSSCPASGWLPEPPAGTGLWCDPALSLSRAYRQL